MPTVTQKLKLTGQKPNIRWMMGTNVKTGVQSAAQDTLMCVNLRSLTDNVRQNRDRNDPMKTTQNKSMQHSLPHHVRSSMSTSTIVRSESRDMKDRAQEYIQ